ncbi:hypothetical protein D9Q98_007215 [Chlorella vulgaris]|uniref:Uncharacterized protein n=1 Tax=Chlorella vulgaris TaxID=3077 RepID=A0A9D4TJM6_CHLVU|nr:hypothetical protein D9Q98_007215 [Chlorella vulgaris]
MHGAIVFAVVLLPALVMMADIARRCITRGSQTSPETDVKPSGSPPGGAAARPGWDHFNELPLRPVFLHVRGFSIEPDARGEAERGLRRAIELAQACRDGGGPVLTTAPPGAATQPTVISAWRQNVTWTAKVQVPANTATVLLSASSALRMKGITVQPWRPLRPSKVKGQRLQSGFGASEAHTRVSAA